MILLDTVSVTPLQRMKYASSLQSLNKILAGELKPLQRMRHASEAAKLVKLLGGTVEHKDGQETENQESSSSSDRFADTGYIAGSRKEMASNFIRKAGKEGLHLGVTDIDWLAIEENPREAAEVITKANVIGKPDYEALVSNGMKPATAFLISKVYTSIAPKPVSSNPQSRKAYVRGIETLRAKLEAMKEPQEVADFLSKTVYEEMTQPSFTGEEIEELNNLEKGDQRRFDIYRKAMERTQKESDTYAAWASLGDRFKSVVKFRFSTGSKAFRDTVSVARRGKPDDMDWAEKKQEDKKASGEDKEPKKPKFELFVSDSFERVGGRNVSVSSTAELKSMFNLRDIQSGNWVLKDKSSAEFHVTRSAEAFADMADVLGIDDRKVSMGGRLAMAFGARGKAGARAHYEPVQRVINLTKMNGGGSLAHEWFHAFDNLLIEAMGVGTSDSGDYLTESPKLATASPSVASAFDELVKAMTVGDAVVKRRVKYTGLDVTRLKTNMQNGYMKKLIAAGSFDEAYKLINTPGARFAKGAKQAFESLAAAYYDGSKEEGGELSASYKTGNTYFYENALLLDGDKGKKYWSLNLELAARAFSSFIEDKMSEMGRKNDYLSNHANNDAAAYGFISAKPFPEGSEREKINDAFGKLFAVVKQENVLDSIISLFNCELDSVEPEPEFGFDLF